MPRTQKTISTSLSITSLSVLATFTVFSGISFAQGKDLSADTILDASEVFNVSDVNQDGRLDREEFVSFATSKAQQGDINYGALIVSGDFDNEFNTHDYNADGSLSLEELKMPDASHLMEGEEPEVETEVEE